MADNDPTVTVNANSDSGDDDWSDEGGAASKATLDRSLATKMFIEQHYANLHQNQKERGHRRLLLEKQMENMRLTNKEQNDLRKELDKQESAHIRMKRRKFNQKDFETVKIIGRGAFGEVRLVRMNESPTDLYAMKKLKKDEMLKKEQVAHVRAERDVLAQQANNPWVVKLYYSFQDERHLYLVMEYLPGGDMMNLLIKYDIFTEAQTRFYIAETLLAIESVHKLGYIHRDIKPDNLLLDQSGHVKLTDFGLCTGFHRMHSSAFYQKLVGDAMTIKRRLVAETPLTRTERIASWKKARRALAYSAVGTPDYTAPEVFLQVGYGHECDFWSLGVIMFEMLIGYPPFLSDNSTETCLKIINCKETLRFPEDIKISHEAQSLIEQLVCDRSGRLGSEGAEEIKNHPFFKGVNWDTIRDTQSPFIPSLNSPTDTSHFPDEYEELAEDEEEQRYAEATKKGLKFPAERDLPFIGYTFKGFDGGGRRGFEKSKERRPTLEDIFDKRLPHDT